VPSQNNSDGIEAEAPNNAESLDSVPETSTVSDSITPSADTIIWYSRSGCFGTCPAYSFILFDNHQLNYTGHRYADPAGKHSTTLDEDLFDKFASLIQSAKLETYSGNYPPSESEWIVDLPTSTIVWYDQSHSSHVIRNNHSAPQALNDFEKALYELLQSVKWRAN
jgi:hypothetical protein